VNVLVTGGTGTVGRHVVMLLRQSGHRARIFSRNPRGHVDAVQGDLRTGAGLDKAIAGMDSVIHAATAARQSLIAGADIKSTQRLLKKARDVGIKHFVYVSIVGMEGVAYPYYRTKLKVEAIVKQDLVPWSILRATQFHELMEVFLSIFTVTPAVAMLPFDWQFQPVHAKEVAQRLVDAVQKEPAGVLPDFGGPEVRDFKSLADSWLKARGIKRDLLNIKLPFEFSRQFAEGRLLTPEHRDGKVTFEQYLEEKYPPR
jgi:uncharacterized protein YbjT (DUF2867 family)